MRSCQEKICQECGEFCCYNERYDAYFCAGCDRWNSPKCDEKDCFFCPKRPKYPSECKAD